VTAVPTALEAHERVGGPAAARQAVLARSVLAPYTPPTLIGFPILERASSTAVDILFLLNPNFTDGARDSEGKRYYCPSCAFLEGVLCYCPELREKLDIRYIDYPRPRREIIALVGDANQGCPNLVLDSANHAFVDASRFYRAGDHLHTNDTKVIVEYLAVRYGVQIAHF
jgi:hypothetical protein